MKEPKFSNPKKYTGVNTQWIAWKAAKCEQNMKKSEIIEFSNLLKQLEISRKNFAEEIGVTYGSINVMLSDNQPTPKWVISALIVARKLKESGI
jgi:hypothetical protein